MNYGAGRSAHWIATSIVAAAVALSSCAVQKSPGVARVKPEDRVLKFIADYQAEHRKIVPPGAEFDPPDDALERWDKAVARLDSAHFIDGGGRELADVFQGGSPHRIETENII